MTDTNDNALFMERRESERSTYERWVFALILNEDASEVRTQIKSPAFDLSEHGLGMNAALVIPNGSKVVMRLSTRGSKQELWVYGEVVRCEQKYQDGWYKLGIRYDTVPDDIRERVDGWMRELAEMLPKAA